MEFEKLISIEISQYTGDWMYSNSSVGYLIERVKNGLFVVHNNAGFDFATAAPTSDKQIKQKFILDEHLVRQTKALLDTLLSYPVPKSVDESDSTTITIKTSEGTYHSHPNAVTLKAFIEYFKAINISRFIDVAPLSCMQKDMMANFPEPIVGECIPTKNTAQKYDARQFDFWFRYLNIENKHALDIFVNFDYADEYYKGNKVTFSKTVKIGGVYFIDEQSVILPTDVELHNDLLSLIELNGDLNTDSVSDDYCLIKCDEKEIKIRRDELPDLLVGRLYCILRIKEDPFDFSFETDKFLNPYFTVFNLEGI